MFSFVAANFSHDALHCWSMNAGCGKHSPSLTHASQSCARSTDTDCDSPAHAAAHSASMNCGFFSHSPLVAHAPHAAWLSRSTAASSASPASAARRCRLRRRRRRLRLSSARRHVAGQFWLMNSGLFSHSRSRAHPAQPSCNGRRVGGGGGGGRRRLGRRRRRRREEDGGDDGGAQTPSESTCCAHAGVDAHAPCRPSGAPPRPRPPSLCGCLAVRRRCLAARRLCGFDLRRCEMLLAHLPLTMCQRPRRRRRLCGFTTTHVFASANSTAGCV